MEPFFALLLGGIATDESGLKRVLGDAAPRIMISMDVKLEGNVIAAIMLSGNDDSSLRDGAV